MRAPFQVLVVPFFTTAEGSRFLVLRRADMDVWQWIAGGGEDGETPLEAASRESAEELGVEVHNIIPLQTVSSVPAFDIAGRLKWGREHLVVKEYAFAVALNSQAVVLSAEHLEGQWVSAGQAQDMLRWDSNRTALHELNLRLAHGWLSEE